MRNVVVPTASIEMPRLLATIAKALTLLVLP
jgi:hypothetical protein